MPVSEPGEKRIFGVTDLLLVLMAVIWGVNFSVAKYAEGIIGVQVFVVLRVVLATLVLGAVALLRTRPQIDGRTWIRLILLGVIGHGFYQYVFFTGLSKTRAGDAALIVGATPAFIAVASRMRGLEKVRTLTIIGIVLAMAGVALVIIGGGHSAPGSSTVAGSVLVFIAVILWALYSVGLQPYTKRVGLLQLSAITMIGGAVPLLVLTAPAVLRENWSAIGSGAWLALLYSSVISVVIGYMLWYRGLRLLGPTRTSVYNNLVPVVAIFVAWIFLAEVPTIWQAIGMVAIVSGIFLTRT